MLEGCLAMMNLGPGIMDNPESLVLEGPPLHFGDKYEACLKKIAAHKAIQPLLFKEAGQQLVDWSEWAIGITLISPYSINSSPKTSNMGWAIAQRVKALYHFRKVLGLNQLHGPHQPAYQTPQG